MSKAVAVSEFSLFAAYDLAVKRWCNKVTNRVQSSIPAVAASPQRAFAEARRVIERNTVRELGNRAPSPDGKDALIGTPKVPLPFLSIVRGSVNNRPGRTYPADNLFRRTLPPTDTSGRFRFKSRPPIPLTIDYQVDIWTKTVDVQAKLVDVFEEEFCQVTAYGMADISKDWGKHIVPIHFRGWTDVGEQEGGELGDRVVRYSLAIAVDAWKFFDWAEALTAESIVVDQDQMTGVEVHRVVSPHVLNLFIQGEDGQWFRFFLDNGGEMYLFPSEIPKTNITIYKAKNIVFDDGFFIREDTAPNRSYLVFRNEKRAQVDTVFTPTIWDNTALPNVVIQKDQNLLIGGSGNAAYSQFRVSNRWVPQERSRILTQETDPA